MKAIDIAFIKEKHKWRIVWTDIFDRYFILTAPLWLVFLSFMISYFSINQDSDYSFLLVTIPIFFFGCLTFYLVLNRIESERKFKPIKLQNDQAFDIEKCINQLGWRLSSKNDKVVTLFTKISFFSWGETITIILDDNQLLFNSRPQGSQPFTFNRDKVNYKKLCNTLKDDADIKHSIK
jgi:hypothetical protein